MNDTPDESPTSMRQCLRLWLEALNRDQGSRFDVDADGRCAFQTGEHTPCLVEGTDETATIHLTAAVGQLPADADAALLRQLLAMNHPGFGPMGGTLALNPANGWLLLTQTWPVFAADLHAFVVVLGSFMEAADRLRAELAERAPLAVAGAGDAPAGAFMVRA